MNDLKWRTAAIAVTAIAALEFVALAGAGVAIFGNPLASHLGAGTAKAAPKQRTASLGLSASGKIVARALQKYGAFVGDFSLAVSLYAEASPAAQAVWNAGLLDTYEIKDQVGLSKFRVLEIGALYDNAN